MAFFGADLQRAADLFRARGHIDKAVAPRPSVSHRESLAVVTDLHADSVAALADRDGGMGGVGMADTVAEGLPSDAQYLPFLFLGQDFDGSGVKIQADPHTADLIVGRFQRLEFCHQVEVLYDTLVEPVNHLTDVVNEPIDLLDSVDVNLLRIGSWLGVLPPRGLDVQADCVERLQDTVVKIASDVGPVFEQG